jgi:hypothetical protein
MQKFAANPKRVEIVHARYDLTFLPEYSHQVIASFTEHGIDFVAKALPCGHYTTGETPYKFIDGWWLGSFVVSSFRDLARKQPAAAAPQADPKAAELVERES